MDELETLRAKNDALFAQIMKDLDEITTMNQNIVSVLEEVKKDLENLIK